MEPESRRAGAAAKTLAYDLSRRGGAPSPPVVVLARLAGQL